MTIKELIAKLNEYPSNMPVLINERNHGLYNINGFLVEDVCPTNGETEGDWTYTYVIDDGIETKCLVIYDRECL